MQHLIETNTMFAFARLTLRALKQALTGEVLYRVDIETMGGVAKVSLRLKQDRSSGDRYFVLAGLSSGSATYFLFEADELHRFIEAANDVQAFARTRVVPSAQGSLGWWKTISMVLTSDEIQRSDTEIHDGYCTMSLRLKRNKRSGMEFVILAGKAMGHHSYFSLDTDQFERFVAEAKYIRTAMQSEGIGATNL
jgi:hypothetical protein